MPATPLPRLMVAPNGARLTDDDHPAVPVTIPQIVTTAQECASAGARAMHFHVRGDDKAHILDAGLYREALGELALAGGAVMCCAVAKRWGAPGEVEEWGSGHVGGRMGWRGGAE